MSNARWGYATDAALFSQHSSRLCRIPTILLFRFIMDAVCLSLFPTRDIAVLSRHDPTRMNHIEYDKGSEHRKGVDAVLIHFVVGDIALQSFCVFDQSKDNPHLHRKLGHQSPIEVEHIQ
jgi:hypothetical protein